MNIKYAKMYIKITASSLSLQPQLVSPAPTRPRHPNAIQSVEHHPAVTIVVVEPQILQIAQMFAMLADILGIGVLGVELRLGAALFTTVDVLFVFFVDVGQAWRFAAVLVRSLLFVVKGEQISVMVAVAVVMQRRCVLFFTVGHLLDLLLFLVLEY